MKKVLIATAIAFAAFTALMAYGCCVAASEWS